MAIVPYWCLCDSLSQDQSEFVRETILRGEQGNLSGVIGKFVNRWLDIPPVWLLAAVVIVWTQAKILPLGPGNANWVPAGLVWLLWGLAATIAAAALWQMRQHRTSFHPHDTASHLVTTGIFGLTRNPIYVADILVLVGVVMRFGTWASAAMIGLFIWVLQRRFVLVEELRLKSQFPAQWAEYKNKTRRWI